MTAADSTHTPRPSPDPSSGHSDVLAAALAKALAEGAGAEGGGGETLASLGFRDLESSWRHFLRLTEKMAPDARRAFIHVTAPALGSSADPDLALVNLLRYGESAFGADQLSAMADLPTASLERLCHLFGYSSFLANLLVRYPEHAQWLQSDPSLHAGRYAEDYQEVFQEAMADHPSHQERRIAAIGAQRRELLRLGVRRMLDLSDEIEMTRELSLLASAALELALAEVSLPLLERFGRPVQERDESVMTGSQEGRFTVIAMGKLGGYELNFSSDIDLLFIYSEEGMTTGLPDGTGRITLHQYFTRLAEALIAYLSEATEEGSFYRIDTRLRPDGFTGPLVRSLSAYEIYYETQARPWERMALIKARHVAGDGPLGRAFEAMCRPLVFYPLCAEELLAHIHDQKLRIDHEVSQKLGAHREVKRGAGGIREIEFRVQAMQMVHGANNPRLFTSNLLQSIERLCEAGLLEPDTADQMSADYLFLRTVEHRLQMMHLRQTHMIPEDPKDLEALGRRCGLTSRDGLRPGELLMARCKEIAQRVHQAFVEFFQPATDASRRILNEEPIHEASRLILSAAPEGEVMGRLEPFGLGSGGAVKALRRLGGMGPSTYLSSEGRQAFEQLLPRILRACQTNPQPEVALANLESFLQALGAIASFYTIFLSNPMTFDLLMMAMGSGNAMAQTLIAHPEFMDYLIHPEPFTEANGTEAMEERLERWTGRARDDEQWCAALARFRRFEYLMAGMGELAGELDYETSCGRLSTTAEMIVDCALTHAARGMELPPATPRFCVLALGKFGSGELNHHSDLDLIFVWDEGFAAGSDSPAEVAAELAQRMVGLLTFVSSEGQTYVVDARLRPEGGGAPLAPPLSRYLEYYAERARIWEFQSAMKLRPIAGDMELGRRMVRRVAETIAQRCGSLALAEELGAMRTRMEEAGKTPRWVLCDFKIGRGGLVDLEFIAQFLQLRHLETQPDWIGLGTMGVFQRLTEGGVIDSALAATLRDDYIWLRRLEWRSRLLFESERSHLPSGGDKLKALERACGALLEPGEETLVERVRASMRRNRSHFERLVRDPAQPE